MSFKEHFFNVFIGGLVPLGLLMIPLLVLNLAGMVPVMFNDKSEYGIKMIPFFVLLPILWSATFALFSSALFLLGQKIRGKKK